MRNGRGGGGGAVLPPYPSQLLSKLQYLGGSYEFGAQVTVLPFEGNFLRIPDHRTTLRRQGN